MQLKQELNRIKCLFLEGAVIPKYGRIVIFRNIIDHSARPPSPDFLAARYTFAVKVILVMVIRLYSRCEF